MNFNLRTTNHVEGWHRLFNEKIKIAHPNLFALIKAIQQEEETNRIRMLELDNGHRLQPMKKVYRDLNTRIIGLTQELSSGNGLLENFLEGMINTISDPYIISNSIE